MVTQMNDTPENWKLVDGKRSTSNLMATKDTMTITPSVLNSDSESDDDELKGQPFAPSSSEHGRKKNPPAQ